MWYIIPLRLIYSWFLKVPTCTVYPYWTYSLYVIVSINIYEIEMIVVVSSVLKIIKNKYNYRLWVNIIYYSKSSCFFTICYVCVKYLKLFTKCKNCDARLTTLFYLHKIMKIIDITNNIPNTISIHGKIYHKSMFVTTYLIFWQNHNNSINNSSANKYNSIVYQ